MKKILVVAESYRESCFYLREAKLPIPPAETPEVKVKLVVDRFGLKGYLKEDSEVHLVGRYFLNNKWTEIENELHVMKALGFNIYTEKELRTRNESQIPS